MRCNSTRHAACTPTAPGAAAFGMAALLAACTSGAPNTASDPMPARIDVAQFDNPMEPGTAGSTLSPTTTCSPGQQHRCFCPDGTQSGSQTCLDSGRIGPCVGCRVAGAEQPIAHRSVGLCEELEGLAGCRDQSFRSEELPASILFLVDRSGSMLCNPPEVGQTSEECERMALPKYPDQPSKWDLTVSALEAVIADLADSGASAGLAFLSNNDDCGVHSTPTIPVRAVDASHAATLAGALADTKPGGGTPIVGGTILAYAHLYGEAGLDRTGGCATPPCGAPGNRFVILITDGADSCPAEPFDGACRGGSCTDHLLDTSVVDAVNVNIRTFVIGAPGSEPARGFLSELALIGGTGRRGGQCLGDRHAVEGDCHYDMTATTDFAADLKAALDAISGSAIGCEFPVPQLPDEPPTDNVNVQYRAMGTGDPVCFGHDARPCSDGADGWQFGKLPDGSDDLSRVVLCGQACDTVQRDPNAQVDVVLGCGPITLL
ncbi:MAG: VWA domain-containing protein [Myxococcales bacterium]|nr:VWA domain-containing protein [Myxococcales bacterium]MDD9964790.1 VWA domain-containing protein [Myxococcales bacterium]